jgi:hypothetical protein
MRRAKPMTIFENTLINLIQNKCRDKEWWIFRDTEDVKRYWQEKSLRIDPRSRYFAISVNELQLNIIGFDAISEHPNIDMESVLISAQSLEKHYEEMYFG